MNKKNLLIILSYILFAFVVIFLSLPQDYTLANSINATVGAVNEQSFIIDTTVNVSGSLSNSNGTSLQFLSPADALTSGEGVRMIIQAKNKSVIIGEKPVPSDKTMASTVYEISFEKTSDSSPVTSFDKAITLTFTYTDSEMVGADESTARVYRWNGSSWQILTDSLIDTSANTITASSQTFGTTFALLGNTITATESVGDSASSAITGGGSGGIRASFLNALFPFLFNSPAKPTPPSDVDFNGDGKVDIVDLSILLYRWQGIGPEVARYDLSKNNEIDLADISILFFYWTG